MNNLINKYGKDELTQKELSELRKNLKSMPEEEIERQLYANWLNDDIDTSSVEDDAIKKLKDNIDTTIGRKYTGLSLFVRWSRTVAAILLPVFIIFTVYLYRENNLILSDEMFVTTGKAERANITLPDGTIVSLNAESILGYHPKGYNKKERTVKLNGEGYFQVYKNEKIPFIINSKGLQIKVLGTIFNLSVREKNTTAQLAVEEGSVSLLSIRNNQNVVLSKNQKAILDYLTGYITVITDENIRDISAWRRGDMVFRNTELSQVIRTIEENYNMTIKINCKKCLSDRFTGTLPVNALNEVLEIIERSYHLEAEINRKEIILKSK